jgi:hypothetical protein
MRKILSVTILALSLAATSLTYIASAQAGKGNGDKNDCNPSGVRSGLCCNGIPDSC